MLLSTLTRKEKLKFLDLAIHIALVDGDATEQENRMLKLMVAEVSDDVFKEYHFVLSDNLEETIQFFEQAPKRVKNIVYMNLFKISVVSPVYTTNAHFLLEDIRYRLGIVDEQKRDLIHIVYSEKDLREKALSLVNK
ncbi:hypothetical protein LJC17_01820 [Acholeplasma sp. OttesenSCG-928-E16]|nr:hypothetical protein [Acholeplasma sp. OttesenSCG-928-E16]